MMVTLLVGGAVIALFCWWMADVHYILRWSAGRDQLERERRWTELRAYYEADYRTRRPFVRLTRWLLTPGAAEIRYGTGLHRLGDQDDALVLLERGIERARKVRILRPGLSMRALVLGAMGRYDEARRLAPEIVRLGGEGSPQLVPVAIADVYDGKLDEALALLQKIISAHPSTDEARIMATQVLVLKGELDAALRMNDVATSDGVKYFDPAGLHALRQSRDGAALVERVRERHASIMQPGRLLSIARVQLAAEDAGAALAALESCRPFVVRHALLEATYHRLKAIASALAGDAAESDQSIARMWEVVRAHPGLPRRNEWQGSAGIAAAKLGRLDEARALLQDALDHAKHPIDTHVLRFEMAELHAKAGRDAEARAGYERVVADGIPSRFRTRALAALG